MKTGSPESRDRHQKICFSVALWNGRDPILKERLFGLTGNEGNHGEDCKECYFYLDSTPTHSYMKYLYKYPQAAYPYESLVNENRRRGKDEREFELLDTGVFDDGRYFDVFVEYAKADCEDILVRITVANRGPEAAAIHVLPTVWFRNTWSWSGDVPKPSLKLCNQMPAVIELNEPEYGRRWLLAEGSPDLLFTENETNFRRLYGATDASIHAKDSINDYVVNGALDVLNPGNIGTKAAAHYSLTVPAGESVVVRARLTNSSASAGIFDESFEAIFADRMREADEFYATVVPADLSEDGKNVMRQAFGGLLWSKQFYHYVVRDWLEGDPAFPSPPQGRKHGRNSEWKHLYNADVISMPDKWEYPWYAAWDLAFHCVPLALVDSEFAKEQLTLDGTGMVHASERSTPSVRVGLWRRESAGSCMGRVASVQDREEASRRRRSRLPATYLSQAAAQLHVVGEPQGRRRPQRVPGRLPRSGQHRSLRSERPTAYRRAYRAGGRYRVDGNVQP